MSASASLLPVGEGVRPRCAGHSRGPGEGSVSAIETPNPGADFVRATFSHKGEEGDERNKQKLLLRIVDRHHLSAAMR